jgi:LuxR family transcriptional activator of conjugal transfer of Ti plasmids
MVYRGAELSSAETVFQDFIDALWSSHDATALRNVAARAATHLGFHSFAYLSIDGRDTQLLSTYPKEWTDRYFEKHYENIDPVVITSHRERQAFIWQGPQWGKSLPSQLKRFFSEAHDFHINSGVTIPIRGGFGKSAAFTFATDASRIEVQKALTKSADVFGLIGLYFHTRAELTLKEPPASAPPFLTQREIQCLIWAAKGKTMSETAEITGLSRRTVLFHLENARVKLGASNITNAVAIAVKLKIISP